MASSTGEGPPLFQREAVGPSAKPTGKGGLPMGRPRFTEYLLKLATDADELQKYRAIRDGHDKSTDFNSYLTQQPYPGLEPGQVEALKQNDSHKIVEAVVEELAQESANPDNPFWGIGITFTVECNRITQPRPPLP
jgi:hypothetical protein